MSSPRANNWLIACLMLGILLALAPLQEGIQRSRPGRFDPDRQTRLLDPNQTTDRTRFLRKASTPAIIAALGGFRTVAADLLWLKAERVWHGGNWANMDPILEAVTQLDPHFLLAWITRGWHCAYNLHGEAQIKSEKDFWLQRGVNVFEDAVAANPDSWQLSFQLAWTLYDRARDHQRAAEWARRTAEFPEATPYTARLCYRPYEHIMDFEHLFPAMEYAKSRFPDDTHHQFLVNRDIAWWTEHRDDPQEHRRQIVIENTARRHRAIDYYLYPDDPYWEVCPRCGLPSPKGSDVCQNLACGYVFPRPQEQEAEPAEAVAPDTPR